MKILIDMNLSPRRVQFFSAANIEAAHWSAIGSAELADMEIIAYASTNDFLVLPHDLDFGSILAAAHNEKPSVIQIRMGNISPDSFAGLSFPLYKNLRLCLKKALCLPLISIKLVAAYYLY